jgi:hypothetical protein
MLTLNNTLISSKEEIKLGTEQEKLMGYVLYVVNRRIGKDELLVVVVLQKLRCEQLIVLKCLIRKVCAVVAAFPWIDLEFIVNLVVIR